MTNPPALPPSLSIAGSGSRSSGNLTAVFSSSPNGSAEVVDASSYEETEEGAGQGGEDEWEELEDGAAEGQGEAEDHAGEDAVEEDDDDQDW